MSKICCKNHKTQLIQFTNNKKVAKRDLNDLKMKKGQEKYWKVRIDFSVNESPKT